MERVGIIGYSRYKIFHRICNFRRQFNKGFAVQKSLVATIKDFKHVIPRISVLTLSTWYFDISFVNLHAPTMDKQKEKTVR